MVKGCEVLLNNEEVEGIEPDSIIFVPDKAKIILKNSSKHNTGIMKVQLTVCENGSSNKPDNESVNK